MKIDIFADPFPHLIINEIYKSDIENKIWNELFYLSNVSTTATKPGMTLNIPKKKGTGVFLEEIYKERKYSLIALHTEEVLEAAQKRISDMYENPLLVDPYLDYIPWFKFCQCKSILMQVYRNGDYYDTHHDNGSFTMVTLMYKEPKKFTGGDLHFPKYNFTPNLTHNSAIIFPSPMKHKVSEVFVEENKLENARFTLTSFLTA